MKIAKKILGTAIAMSLCCGQMFSGQPLTVEAETTSETLTEGVLSYVKVDEDEDGTFDYIEITDCDIAATEVDIPSEIEGVPVTSIGDYAFSHNHITNIIIPDGVTNIGERAFYHSDVISVTIPDSVEIIEPNAFYFCDSFKDVYISDIESWCSIDFDGPSSNPLDEADNFYMNGELVTEIVIPDSITSIEDYTFYCCKSLKSITIPNSVTSIGNDAFYGCDSLTSITIPDSVISIDSEAFYKCTNLTDVTVSDNVRFIGRNAFSETAWINNQEGPVYYINSIVIGCDKEATYVEIKEGTQIIGEYSFYNSSVESVKIPDSVISIEFRAFEGSALLENQEGPVYYVDKWVVKCDMDATSVEINEETRGIGDYTFKSCRDFKSITIPNSVTSIGKYAFQYCDSLKSVIIPDSVLSIEIGAFNQCEGLENITIGKGVTNIGYGAFDHCESLERVYISDIVAWCNIKHGENEYFYNSGSNPLYYADDFYLNGELVTDLVIPDSVTSIENYAFYGCCNIENVIIPASVTKIGKGAFCGRESRNGYEDILFVGCNSPESITIENPECEIFDFIDTISHTATIYGYSNSTAQAYAEKYNMEFVALDEPTQTTTVTTEPNETTNTTVSSDETPATTDTTVTEPTEPTEPSESSDGDANGDTIINVRDCAFIAKALANGVGDTLPESADFNKDGKINVRDAAAIAAALAKGEL